MSEIGIGVTLSAHYARRMANHDLILSENISAQRGCTARSLVVVCECCCLSKLIGDHICVCSRLGHNRNRVNLKMQLMQQHPVTSRAAAISHSIDPSINHCRRTNERVKRWLDWLTDGLTLWLRVLPLRSSARCKKYRSVMIVGTITAWIWALSLSPYRWITFPMCKNWF